MIALYCRCHYFYGHIVNSESACLVTTESRFSEPPSCVSIIWRTANVSTKDVKDAHCCARVKLLNEHQNSNVLVSLPHMVVYAVMETVQKCCGAAWWTGVLPKRQHMNFSTILCLLATLFCCSLKHQSHRKKIIIMTIWHLKLGDWLWNKTVLPHFQPFFLYWMTLTQEVSHFHSASWSTKVSQLKAELKMSGLKKQFGLESWRRLGRKEWKGKDWVPGERAVRRSGRCKVSSDAASWWLSRVFFLSFSWGRKESVCSSLCGRLHSKCPPTCTPPPNEQPAAKQQRSYFIKAAAAAVEAPSHAKPRTHWLCGVEMKTRDSSVWFQKRHCGAVGRQEHTQASHPAPSPSTNNSLQHVDVQNV